MSGDLKGKSRDNEGQLKTELNQRRNRWGLIFENMKDGNE